MYKICKEEKKTALYPDEFNTSKGNSVNRVPPFSLNNKPTAEHRKTEKIPLERVVIE